MSRLQYVPRPEGGAEREVVFYLHHNCPQARALKPVVEDPDMDLLQFTVGLQGEGMPLDVPFEVTATDSCIACGRLLKTWFAWTGPKIWLPK